MYSGQPTPSEIRSAKREAIGGARKRCRKGKSCSATCIDSREYCLVEFPEPVSASLPKVVNMLFGIFGKKQSEPPLPPVQAKSTATLDTPSTFVPTPRKATSSPADRENKYTAGQLKTKLSENEKWALRDYTEAEGGKSFAVVNKCLRNPEKCGKETNNEVKKQTELMQKALKKLPSNEDQQPFWRGMTVSGPGSRELYEYLQTAKPGTTLKDPGFSSYSFKEDQARAFTDSAQRSILFVSYSKGLTPISEFSSFKKEGEALLGPGVSQTIRSVSKDGSTLIVELE